MNSSNAGSKKRATKGQKGSSPSREMLSGGLDTISEMTEQLNLI